MRAVRELNYTPNAAARSLAAAQGTRIALIYTNPSAAYLSELLVGALAGAARTAAQLVLDTWDNMSHAAERAAARKIAQSVAGVILPPPLCESKAVLSELAAAGIPVVAIASGRFQPDLSSVRIDDFRASQEMTEHLISVGPSRASRFIRGHPNQTASALRYEGFQAAMTRSRPRDRSRRWSSRATSPIAPAWRRPKSCSSRKNPPTAIFASNDDMAAAAVSVAHRRGPGRAARPVRRRLRRHAHCDDRLAGADHRPPADRRDGRLRDRAAVAQYPSAQGRRGARGLGPRHGPRADQARFRGSTAQELTSEPAGAPATGVRLVF